MRRVLAELTESEKSVLRYVNDVSLALFGSALITCSIQYLFA